MIREGFRSPKEVEPIGPNMTRETMLEMTWTCPHCKGSDALPSAIDRHLLTCDACKFSFAAHRQVQDGSTWREQAALFDAVGESWPKVRSDRYRIIRAVANGAQGRILLAHHCHLDQICILKIIVTQDEWRELATARLQAEARAGALIAHRNVAKVLDCDCVDDTWYFAMEYIEGENLRKMLNAVGAMCWQQVVEIGVQIANGLSAIHAADLIHRDIKPSNIMLAANGVAKITDLGLVKIKGLEGDMALTCDGQILGTPYYMAPEQFDGDNHLTHRADLYSLGASMYHLLCGKPPFRGSGVIELSNRHKHDPVIWPEDITRSSPAWLRNVIEVCLAKRPEHRFENAEKLSEALRCGVDVTALVPQAADTSSPVGVVVSAFENMSRQPSDDWIGEALAEFLSARLLDLDGLHVVDRHGLSKLLGHEQGTAVSVHDEKRLLDSAEMLGAATVVVGTYQRTGDKLRIIARSVSRSGAAQPSFSADIVGNVEDLFTLEDQLAAKVIDAIGAHRSVRTGGKVHTAGTENLEAHEKFIKARLAYADASYSKAIRLCNEALAIDDQYIDAVSLIGAAYARIGDYDRALEFHRREEVAARQVGDQRRVAEALGNLGVMYYYQGEYTSAYEFLEKARDLTIEMEHHSDTAKYEGNLGFVLMRLKHFEDAERAFARAIDIHKKYRDVVSLAWPYNGMGGVLLKQQRYAEAAEYYRRALGLANEVEDRVNIGVSHMNLGRCACLMNDYAEAEACFDEALTALNGTNFWNGLTMVYEHLAEMYLQEGKTDSALDAINQRLTLAQKHNNRRMEADAWEQKARAHELAGEKDSAVQCLKRSIEITQQPHPHQSLYKHLAETTKQH